MAPNLAVVVVTWNTRQLTLQTIKTLLADINTHGPDQTEVWVVDNASTDGTAEAIRAEFPSVKLIVSPENIGFGGGNNLALREMGFGNPAIDPDDLPSAVYLLNSDTITHAGTTSTLYATLFNLSDAGVVGARLTYEDGTFQHSAFGFPGLAQLWIDLLPSPARLYETPINGRYPRRRYMGYKPFPVGHTLGATMMLKRDVIQQTGMFDEDFFMYAEEVDWSWRIQKAGWQIYCVPTAHITHLEGQSTRLVKPRSVENLWESRLRLFNKHYPTWKRWLARQIVNLGMRYKTYEINRAFARQEISAKEHDALVAVYRKIRHL